MPGVSKPPRPLALLWCAVAAALPLRAAELVATNALPLLTNAQQVVALGVAGAMQAPHPVRLTAVVTHPVLGRNWLFAQDATAGVLVIYTNASFKPHPGEAVEITGRAGPGQFAAHVFSASVRSLGDAPLPQARRGDPLRLAAGEDFGRWTALEGRVVDILVHTEQLSLLLSLDRGEHVVANVTLETPIAVPSALLHSRIEVLGIPWTATGYIDARPTGFRLHSPGTNFVRILRAGPTNLFAVPPRTLRQLRGMSTAMEEPVRITGTLLRWSGARIYLRTEEGPVKALFVPTILLPEYRARYNPDGLLHVNPQNTKLSARPIYAGDYPGDEVELAGFLRASANAPLVVDAEFRRVRVRGRPPTPRAVPGADLPGGRHDGDLVVTSGRLLERETQRRGLVSEDTLWLEDGSATFQVRFNGEVTNALPSFPKHSLLRVTGICSVEPGELNSIQTARILVARRDDITSLGLAPWWQSWPVGRVLAFGAVLGLAALAWIWLLRRRVAQRTGELAFANRALQSEVEERKRAQADIGRALEAEKELSQLRSRFVSMVSHEFRTPLGVIMSSADILKKYSERLTSARRDEHLQDIHEATRVMSGMMEQVLVLGRAESGLLKFHPQSIDVAAFCRKLADEQFSATNGRCPIAFRCGALSGEARGDEGLLRHLFTNLLSNAVKYSPANATVEFSAERAGDDAVFAVSDRGIGIPAAEAARLFTAFHRCSNVGDIPGTGLGMVIVKRCVELHGGSITFQSEEGKGTTFTLRLPLFARHEAAPA